METEKIKFEKKFEQSVEEIKQEQKNAQDAQDASKPVEYDSWQIELMHYGVHY
jgi:hypothetical protein